MNKGFDFSAQDLDEVFENSPLRAKLRRELIDVLREIHEINKDYEYPREAGVKIVSGPAKPNGPTKVSGPVPSVEAKVHVEAVPADEKEEYPAPEDKDKELTLEDCPLFDKYPGTTTIWYGVYIPHSHHLLGDHPYVDLWGEMYVPTENLCDMPDHYLECLVHRRAEIHANVTINPLVDEYIRAEIKKDFRYMHDGEKLGDDAFVYYILPDEDNRFAKSASTEYKLECFGKIFMNTLIRRENVSRFDVKTWFKRAINDTRVYRTRYPDHARLLWDYENYVNQMAIVYDAVFGYFENRPVTSIEDYEFDDYLTYVKAYMIMKSGSGDEWKELVYGK